ncbi:MAG: glycosyltransferase, partial [Lachnospiraceae bacterium]|nr:glycosyltransferase [Lachnospiraceae bacterium]
MSAKVSIIIPIYNVETYLERCVNSIRNQTLRELEIILIDDGSPDACPQMCDRYAAEDERIKVIHQPNAGVSVARNRGMDAATADWIMFVDPDDWL